MPTPPDPRSLVRLDIPTTLVPALLVAGLLGCADRLPVEANPTPPIPVSQVREVVAALAPVSSVDIAQLLLGVPAGGVAAATTDFFTDTTACPAGGITVVTGKMEFNDPPDPITFDVRDDFRGCGTSDPSGRTWVFDADTPLRAHLVLLTGETGDEPWLTGSLTGRVRFVALGAVGTCDFAVALNGVGDDIVVSGTVCGQDASALEVPD